MNVCIHFLPVRLVDVEPLENSDMLIIVFSELLLEMTSEIIIKANGSHGLGAIDVCIKWTKMTVRLIRFFAC